MNVSLGKYNPIERFANFVQIKCLSSMKNISENLTQDQLEFIGRKADVVMDASGLLKKGIKIVRLPENDNAKQITDIVFKVTDNAKKRLIEPSAHKLLKLQDETARSLINIAKGNNAGYIPLAKTIVVPKDKLALSTFHEMGHALNANMSKFTKVLQKTRSATCLLPILSLFMLKTSKSKFQNMDDKNDRPFVNKHAGALAFLTFVPMLAEEGLASIKGAKLAKKVVSSDMLKAINKTNAFGFATYLIGACATALTFFAVSTIAAKIDRIAAKNQIQPRLGGLMNGKRFV